MPDAAADMPRTVTFNHVAGLRRALRDLPKEASSELREASLDIASDVAGKAAARARMVGGVAVYVAPTIKAKQDRIPKVVMGGLTKLPGRTGPNQTVGNVMWGAEFGGRRRPTTQQFQPWRGNSTGAGYFLWPTIRAQSASIVERYGDALMTAVDKAAR